MGRAATPKAGAQKFCSLRCAKESLAIPLDVKLWSQVTKGDGCWEWTGYRTRFGHGMLSHRGHVLYAHRVSWELHNGPIPDTQNVCHRCDNPSCVRPGHLFLGSHSDNFRDMWTKGRGSRVRAKGESHGRAKLTDALVREIRASAEPTGVIASRLGVERHTVSRVRSRKTWAHVD